MATTSYRLQYYGHVIHSAFSQTVMSAQLKEQPFTVQALAWLHSVADFYDAMAFYDETMNDPKCDNHIIRELAKGDRYFLLVYILNADYAVHPWLYERTREVEANPDGYIDLWAREHFKSTIITYAGVIQEILKDPEITVGIFSHTRPIAKGFLAQIKRELESNEKLKQLFPEICWVNPRADAPTWSMDSGITVNRKSNPRESTVEAWGLVDGQPTSKHFKLLVYDDVVTIASVTTADQIQKTTDAWDISSNLGSKNDDGEQRRWMIGTRYNYADTYHEIMEREAAIPRIYPATDNGTIEGKPVFMTDKAWSDKLRESSLYNVACQMLQNPNAGNMAEFKPEYIRYYEVRPLTLNVYIMCDYADSMAAGSSRTAFVVVGVDHSRNKYILDGVCHRMPLTERWKCLKALRNKWINAKGVQHVSVGYEKFGAQSDIGYFEEKMETEGAFPIMELNWPRTGEVAKDSRIRRLEPDFRNWGIFLPYEGDTTRLQRDAINSGFDYLVSKPIRNINEENIVYNLMDYFIKTEFLFFPNTTAKDFLDALSRIYDMDYIPPMIIDESDVMPEVMEDA